MTVKSANDLWKKGDPARALEIAWAGFEGGDIDAGVLAARILREEPKLLRAERAETFRRLLTHPKINPGLVSAAGWRHLLTDTDLFAGTSDDIAPRLERSALALALLHQDVVIDAQAERALTAVRRALLLEDKTRAFPNLSAALVAQAALNGGAWPFEDDERARFAAMPDFAPAFLPRRPNAAPPADYADPVTRAVAAQYEAWPYPTWTRVMASRPTTLSARVRQLDPKGPALTEAPADILIAGCGSGHQVAIVSQDMPDERLTVIDISRASLDEAERRCTALGFTGVEYRHLDLHAVKSLGKQFDAVWCTGVLHHLSDPEAGWAALESVLKPGGIMHIMVYSRAARLRVRAIRRFLGPLVDQPVDDDLLRAVRRRVLTMPEKMIPAGRDFCSLAAVHDLLLHRHEDPFTIPRIRRALEVLGLQLIRFQLPDQRYNRRYKELYPDDGLQRDFDSWFAMERDSPTLFAGMYDFFCRKPA
ncbi:MAG TPA: class I SAM-dependent methyltransferase [Rhizomicrobium sp.]